MFRTMYTVARIHSTPAAAKTVAEKVTEVAGKVNRKVGKGLASAIETGEKAAKSTKDTLGSGTSSVDEASKLARQKAAAGAQGAKDAMKEAKK